ncbi:MAG: hypothetical protein GF311_26985 [Candidatus Lokiarchaeota archaeon]|nr:hypothetical protein [Candidatus Lokiarchaeota archaeon]
MGLFDTIEFPNAIKCKACGAEITSTQTKMFENLLNHYSVGDILPKYVVTGILKETVCCSHKESGKKGSWDAEIYIVVWNNIFVDVKEEYEQAEKRLLTFSHGDLYLLYRELYNERNEFRYKFNALKSWIENYIEYEKISKEEKEELLKDKHSLINFHMRMFAEKMVESENPLDAYLEELENRNRYDTSFIL